MGELYDYYVKKLKKKFQDITASNINIAERRTARSNGVISRSSIAMLAFKVQHMTGAQFFFSVQFKEI